MEAFVAAVVEIFGLGSTTSLTVEPMVGSANRLWRLEAPSGVFVVKESRTTRPSTWPVDDTRRVSNDRVFDAGVVLMPEPVLGRDGEMVVLAPGSRGTQCPVRLHRWLDGNPITSPATTMLAAAGASLYGIQQVGVQWSSRPTGSIRWWDVDPLEVAERLGSSSIADLGREAASVAADALAVVDQAEQLSGPWSFGHCDHKPDNTLAVNGTPAVLDWDECGHCHPRLETVEAALRWSTPTKPDRSAFEAFLGGYCDRGGQLRELSEPDFGKWIAALLGWFSFQARRAGDWPTDTRAERHEAEAQARDSITALRSSLSALATWAAWW